MDWFEDSLYTEKLDLNRIYHSISLNYRKNKYDYEVLIDNKNEIKKKFKDLNIDKANIDEMMYLLIRGEK